MWCHVEMKEKQNITLYLDRKVIEKARKTGLNISKYCENALVQAIEALNSVSYAKKGGAGTVGSAWSPGRDLNPRPPPYQGDALTSWATEAINTLRHFSIKLSRD